MYVSLVRPNRTDGVVAAITTVLAAAAAAVAVRWPGLGLPLAAGAAMAGVVMHRPVAAAVVAVPGLYAIQRAGPTSASDLLLAVATALAVPALIGTPALRALRPLNLAFAGYLLLLVPTVVVNHTTQADFEWVHRLVLVIGSGLVGAWLVVERRTALALRLLIAVSAVVAVAAVVDALQSSFEPAFPLGYHKNFAGSLLSLSFLLVLAAPHVVNLPAVLRAVLLVTLAVGTVATQSRGAMLGAALGVLLWFFAPHGERRVRGRTRVAGALIALMFAGYAGYSVQEQLRSDDVATTSVGVRQQIEAATRELWLDSPVVGVGIRYFRTGGEGLPKSASNNAVNSELAESGLLGATGFVLFHLAALRILFQRRRTELGIAALATVSCQLLHGMVDIYWSAGVSPLPWILTGMALVVTAQRTET